MVKVFLSDPSEETKTAFVQWLSRLDHMPLQYVTDVSDVSIRTDELWEFHFKEEQEALMFMLQFGGSSTLTY
jgi:hypothetical protein